MNLSFILQGKGNILCWYIWVNKCFIKSSKNCILYSSSHTAFHEVVGRYRGITIDTRESIEVQREMFFHELCHILRHCGVQSMMPAAFREMQERDARHFTRYAAIPYHMIKFIDIEDPYVIDQMVDKFKVTPELCLERLEQIKERSWNHKYIAESLHTYEV
jgi:hypothetical protein